MTQNYRNLARTHLKSAKDELDAKSDRCLKFAALELRMSMEALTYDRALAYKDEFPPDEYKTWQPRKVMSVLLDIDPMADKDSSLAISVEEQCDVPAPKMNSLGSEKVLSMKVLKKHYDALGSYLHIKSMKQMNTGDVIDYNKIRTRCQGITALIEQALASPVFNITLGSFATLECVECNSPIRKRLPSCQKKVHAECYQCKATYSIIDEGGGKVKWVPHQHEIECANDNCQQKIVVWQHELEVERHWICKDCKGENTFVLAVKHKEAPNKLQPMPRNDAPEI